MKANTTKWIVPLTFKRCRSGSRASGSGSIFSSRRCDGFRRQRLVFSGLRAHNAPASYPVQERKGGRGEVWSGSGAFHVLWRAFSDRVYRMVDSLVLSRVYWPAAARFNPRLAAGGWRREGFSSSTPYLHLLPVSDLTVLRTLRVRCPPPGRVS